MGAPGVGHKSFIQMGKETTWGTPVGVLIRIPILNDTLELEAPPIPDNVLHGNPWERTKYQGPRRVTGEFSTDLMFEGMLEFIRGCFGQYQSAVVETGVRDHTFKIGVNLNGYTIEETLSNIPTGKVFQVQGAKFNRLVLRGVAGQGPEAKVSAAFGVIGKDRVENVTGSSGPADPPLLPVKFDLATVVDDGTADPASNVRVRSFTFTLENGLADDRLFMGSLFIDEPVRVANIRATFEFQQEFQTITQYTAYRALTTGSPRLVFQHPATIGAASKREFEIRANQAYLEKVSMPVDGPGVIIASSTWVATFDGVDTGEASPVVCRVRNTEGNLT